VWERGFFPSPVDTLNTSADDVAGLGVVDRSTLGNSSSVRCTHSLSQSLAGSRLLSYCVQSMCQPPTNLYTVLVVCDPAKSRRRRSSRPRLMEAPPPPPPPPPPRCPDAPGTHRSANRSNSVWSETVSRGCSPVRLKRLIRKNN